MNCSCANDYSHDETSLRNMFGGNFAALEEISRINRSGNRGDFYAFFRIALVLFKPWRTERIRKDGIIRALSDVFTSTTGKAHNPDDILRFIDRNMVLDYGMHVEAVNSVYDTFLNCCAENDFAELYPNVVKRLFEPIEAVFERRADCHPREVHSSAANEARAILYKMRRILEFPSYPLVEVRGADGQIIPALLSRDWQKLLKEYVYECTRPDWVPTSYDSRCGSRFRYRGLRLDIMNFNRSARKETYYDLREKPGRVHTIEHFSNGSCKETLCTCNRAGRSCKHGTEELHDTNGPAFRHHRKGKPPIERYYLRGKEVDALDVLGVLPDDVRPARDYFAPSRGREPCGNICG